MHLKRPVSLQHNEAPIAFEVRSVQYKRELGYFLPGFCSKSIHLCNRCAPISKETARSLDTHLLCSVPTSLSNIGCRVAFSHQTNIYHNQGLAQPPATSTHSAKQDPCLPSTSTISVSHLHLHPTPFSLTGSQESQYSSSSFRFFSSRVVFSRNGDRGI